MLGLSLRGLEKLPSGGHVSVKLALGLFSVIAVCVCCLAGWTSRLWWALGTASESVVKKGG